MAIVRSGVITKAVRGRDGTIWAEVRRAGRPNGTWRRIVRIGADGGRRTSETGDVRLSHVGVMGRRGRATVVALGWFASHGAEDFEFRRRRGGTARGLFDPNNDAPLGPPLHSTPMLSPRGAKLAWAEGPEFAPEQNRVVGSWKLVIADRHTGAESLRLRVGREG